MIKKIFTGIGIFIFLLVAAVIIIPFAFKGKLLDLAKKEANKNFNATLNFDNKIGLSVIKSFPNLTLKLHNFSIINKDPFKGDTLVYIPDFSATLDIMSVFKGEKIKVYSVSISNSKIYLHILSNGKANWDITLPDTSPVKKPSDTVSSFRLALKKYVISDSRIIYKDESSGMIMKLENFNHNGQGDFTQDVYDLITHTTISAFTFTYGGVDYLNKVNTQLDAVLNINMKEMKFTFKDNLLKLNEFFLKFAGSVALPEKNILVDLKFDSPQTDFKNLISLIPAIYTKDFKDIKTSGKMSFNGYVKGNYNDKSYPGFNIRMLVNSGMFRYPSLPTAINQVEFDLKVDCPDGNFDHMVIDLNKLHFEVDKEPFDAKLMAKTLISDPYIEAAIKGKIDLGQIKNFVPLDKGTSLNGTLAADIEMKGNLSAIDKKQYDKFKATGNLNFNNVTYVTPDIPQQIDVQSMKLNFTPMSVVLQNMSMKIGKNDIQATGNLNNFLAYFFGKGILNGELNINSNMLDLNSLMASSTTAQTKSDTGVSLTAPILPANVDFTMNSKINRLVYDKIDASNVLCLITLKDKILTIKNMSMNVFNGSISINNGTYNTQNSDNLKVFLNINLKHFDIIQAFNTFGAIKAFAPIAKYGKGTFDARFEVGSDILKNLKPDLNSLFSSGNLFIEKITLEGFKPLDMVANELKMDKYKKLTIQNINPSYVIKNGIFNLKPVNFKVDQSEFTVDGTNSLDKSMNYNMKIKIPSKELNNQASSAISQLSQNKLNMNLGEFVTVHVKMLGTIDNPKITVSLSEIKETIKEQVKTQVKEKAKEEVNKQKEQLKTKANEELNKQKQELDQKSKKELENQKKKLDEEAKKKLKGLF